MHRTRLLNLLALVLTVLALVIWACNTAAAQDDDPGSDPAPPTSPDGGDSDPGMRTNPAGDPESGDPGANIGPRTETTPPPASTEAPAEKPAEPEESDDAKRARAERMAGWTFNRAIPRTHANAWLTHWNDDFKHFIHDLHAGFEIAFDIDEFRASVWAALGVRWQATLATTGFDNLWLGGKFAVAGGGKGTFTILTSLGLPIGKHVGDFSAIFTDAANGQLIAFQDINLDLGLAYSLVGKTAGLNIDLHINFPVGLATEISFNGGAEVVVLLVDKDPGLDLHAGFMFSTAFTPFIPYGEVSLQLGESMSISGRLQFMLGEGPNFGNIADIVMMAIFDIRFGGPSSKKADDPAGDPGAGSDGGSSEPTDGN